MDLAELGRVAKSGQTIAYFPLPDGTARKVIYPNREARLKHLRALQTSEQARMQLTSPFVSKAQNKRRKDKDGKPVGRGKWSNVQREAAREAAGAEAPVVVQGAPAKSGRLVRSIRPAHVAAVVVPVSVGGAGYAFYRRSKKNEKPALATPQMRQMSSKM